jgi:hypothetical protein
MRGDPQLAQVALRGRVPTLCLALLGVLVLGGIGAASAPAKRPASILELTKEAGGPFIPADQGTPIEQIPHFTLSFKIKGKSEGCETEGLFLEGRVESNAEPTDALTIVRPQFDEAECPPTAEGQPILTPETYPWSVTASTSGKSELRAPGGIKMRLEVIRGEPVLECHFENAALVGSNNASAGEEPLTIRFSAAKNKLRLNKATSTHGCPGSLKVGFALAPKASGSVERPWLYEHVQAAQPAFSIEKLQEIAGSGAGFTRSKLSAKVGETVDYEIVVANTGNESLNLGALSDEHCEGLSGGPGAAPLEPNQATTYRCQHALSAQDLAAGSYSNTAGDTGTPPKGGGSPIMHSSNTVVVEVKA